jgi:hypothetical protein
MFYPEIIGFYEMMTNLDYISTIELYDTDALWVDALVSIFYKDHHFVIKIMMLAYTSPI